MTILRQAGVYVVDQYAGLIQETDEGYCFAYDEAYLKSPSVKAVSLTMVSCMDNP